MLKSILPNTVAFPYYVYKDYEVFQVLLLLFLMKILEHFYHFALYPVNIRSVADELM